MRRAASAARRPCRFAAEGAKVVVADLSEGPGSELADEIGGTFVRVNVADEQSVKDMYADVVATYGGLDVLFNNAGISPADDDLILTTELDAWRRVQEVNLTSVYLCCKYGAIRRRTRHNGRLVAARQGHCQVLKNHVLLLTFESDRGMGARQVVRRLEAGTGKALGETAVGVHKDYLATGACLSGDGKLLLVPSGRARSSFSVWNLTMGKLARNYRSNITGALLCPLPRRADGGRSGPRRGIVRLQWRGQTHSPFRDGRRRLAANFLAGRQMAGGGMLRSLTVWEVATGKRLRTIEQCRVRWRSPRTAR